MSLVSPRKPNYSFICLAEWHSSVLQEFLQKFSLFRTSGCNLTEALHSLFGCCPIKRRAERWVVLWIPQVPLFESEISFLVVRVSNLSFTLKIALKEISHTKGKLVIWAVVFLRLLEACFLRDSVVRASWRRHLSSRGGIRQWSTGSQEAPL